MAMIMLIALTILDIILSLVRTLQTRSWKMCVCVCETSQEM